MCPEYDHSVHPPQLAPDSYSPGLRGLLLEPSDGFS